MGGSKVTGKVTGKVTEIVKGKVTEIKSQEKLWKYRHKKGHRNKVTGKVTEIKSHEKSQK